MKKVTKSRLRRTVSSFLIFSVIFMNVSFILPSVSVLAESANDSEQATQEYSPLQQENTPTSQQADQPAESTESSNQDKAELPSLPFEQETPTTEETTTDQDDSAKQVEEQSNTEVTPNDEAEASLEKSKPSLASQPSTENKEEDVSTETEAASQPEETVEVDYNQLAPLLITEIMANNDGADNYEYFEVYNNTNQSITLDHYQFFLRYTDGSGKEDVGMDFAPTTLQAGQSIVFWANNAGKALEDFNNYYQSSLTKGQIVEYTGAPGFYNNGNRAVVIKSNDNKDIVLANYLAEDIASGKVIEYKYPESGIEMNKFQAITEPKPGSTVKEQLPEQPVDIPTQSAPTIIHESIQEIGVGEDLKIQAHITDDTEDITAKVFYQLPNDSNYQVIKMTKQGDSYEAIIPKEELVSNSISYLIMVTDPNHRITYPTNFQSPVEVTIKQPVEESFDSYPHLLVTELAPNSQGGGTDYFEYFEIYNNSNRALPLNNYTFVYRYTDTGKEVTFQIPETTIESQQTLVLWNNNGGKTFENFNSNFASDLTSNQVIEITDTNLPGFANSGDRAVVIKDNQGNEIVAASYLSKDNDNSGKDIHYTYPKQGTDMVKMVSQTTPTPGVIEAEQVPTQPATIPEIPEDNESPTINHQAVSEVDAYSSIHIEAIVEDNTAVPTATIYYKSKGDTDFKSLAMSVDAVTPNKYSGEIPGVQVKEDIIYFIEASDGINTTKTEEKTITVIEEDVDYSKLPSLLLTEVVPDTTNVGSADGYEFIEIYNNTDQPISLKDYKIQYRYGTDPESDIVWPSIPEDVEIPSKETLVFWIINGQNDNQTVADFNANFGTNLVENKDIVRIYSAGMSNSSMRGLIIASNAGTELSVSYYNDVESADDTLPDKGIVYKYPVDGTNVMEKVSAGVTDATPGTVEAFQVPKQTVTKPVDTVDPTIENLTEVTEVNQKQDIHLRADVKDDIAVKTVELFYRTNDQEGFSTALLQQDYDDLMYHHIIYSPEIIAKEFVEYYYVVSDGTNQVTSETFRIDITSDLSDASLRLNVENGEVLTRDVVIKGTSKKDSPDNVNLAIDGQQVTESTFQSLEHPAYFAFEVSGVNTYFQNGVTIGDEAIQIFDDWIAQWQTITVPIGADQLAVGENAITIRAGTKASPFDLESTDNRDDYNVRNVRLVLSDGTILKDATFSNPEEVIDMGDDGNYRPSQDFIFNVTTEQAQSKSYLWDTTKFSDGTHVISAVDQDEEVKAEVLVDNTAPTIVSEIEDGKEYKGIIDVDIEIVDEIAGLDKSEIKLDGQTITTPYQTSSGELTGGEHKLEISATDKVGNHVEKTITFTVVDENPQLPESELETGSPIEGDPVLKVKVTDPNGDPLDVGFYQGYRYDPSNTESVKSYSNAADVEPPNTQVPSGETTLTKEDITNVSELDQKYMVTDSVEKFPYHRFDVTVDSNVDENDIVELVWNGNSLEGRKVTMYAWNHSVGGWQIIDYQIAGQEDFQLKGTVPVGDYVKNSKVNVMVQDEIPTSPEEYDYTFVWMSDTQYYSESYPNIYERQTQWIAEKQEEMKIQYVFHTGDLVDEYDQPYQWEHADTFMKTLDDANIPYGVLAGNHDVGQKTNDYTEYYKYFGADRFEAKPYYGDSYLNNRGHYDLMSVGGNDYIMVYLGWGVDEEGLDWVNEVLAAHPDRKAILSFHEYLQATGTRHPLGDKIYEKVVVPNENVFAVLSGHYHESQLLVDEIDDNGDGKADRNVYQILADYQAGPEGGQGYMRLLHFDTDNNRIIVNTYSPYMDDYNYYDSDVYPGKDEFELSLDLQPEEKRVATDYFEVNVYTDNEIGKVKNVSSGDYAEVTWKGLEEGKTYSWYTVASDQFTGETRSNIWSFVKGKQLDQEPPTDPSDPNDGGEGGDNPEPSNPDPSNPEPSNPSVPTPGEPDIPNDQPTHHDSDHGDNTEKQIDQSDNQSGNTADHNSEQGKDLANTATTIYNWLVLGISLIVAGFAFHVHNRRKLI
ncbi:lamin tail domain-containing protein [Aquibacillus kalidii]|uniref:lamin tail domain-containing protein n=1 Tax=Aquibacillus kalidii TaxID=2762597 RepID=UPI0016460585|nr:lamin tail domain-containing protein [Aquibacillus kalidii]